MPDQDAKRLTLNAKRKSKGKKLIANGFTLVELLVVLGLLSITVGSTLMFLTSTLKGSNSAAITAEVKQNGQSVLDSLERQIRGATNVQAMTSGGVPPLNLPAGASSGVALSISGSQSLYIVCFNSVSGIANGWIGTSITNSGIGTYTPLTNKEDLISGISVDYCSFNVTAASGGGSSPPVVSVEFTMSQGISAPSRADFVANAKFQTTISLRQADN